jgi:hypothetical protein
MDRTSTTVPTWQKDCENFAKGRGLFELLNVSTTDHFLFVIEFCKKHDLDYTLAEDTLLFAPRQKVADTCFVSLKGQLMLTPVRNQA